ncbi:MFS transporter [Rhodoplanes serenus]|uniref:MFS transporter n=2 Tax=Rhodoplanes serenus TaxID=200615 RepID=A0A9X4XRK9_9BRAD|nr:MFS transporter [Rhodoplanes serenus]
MRQNAATNDPDPAERPGGVHSTAALVPLMAVVSIAFLIIGVALPVLPLHVHQGLGFGPFAVGLVTGSQFAASLFTRVAAGRHADRHGPKRAVMAGLLAAVASGLLYLVSLGFVATPWLSVGVLLVGRALLGGADSFIITGAAAWGFALAGPQNAGRVIAWVGMAMFAAMALGAPIGTALYGYGDFAAVAIATTVVPLSTLLVVLPMRAMTSSRSAPAGFQRVAGAVWLPGVGSALSSIGFGAILAFGPLLATDRAWDPVWLPFSAFALALVAARLFLGHLPDRLGGAAVALPCVLVEALGLALMWFASGRIVAGLGAALTGFGYSLVYPGLGVEAVGRAPQQSRGLAMGAYTVFLDVALGFGSPALGLIAGWRGTGAVFVASAAVVVCAAAITVPLLSTSRLGETS